MISQDVLEFLVDEYEIGIKELMLSEQERQRLIGKLELIEELKLIAEKGLIDG